MIGQPRVLAGNGLRGGQFAAAAHTESALALETPAAESIVDRDSVFTQRYDTMDAKLAAIHSELENAVTRLGDDAEWQHMLDTLSRFHNYSFSNQMLIALQTGGEATRVAGFRKWKEVDRQVRKGEKGITILAPKMIRKQDTDTNGKPVVGADGKPVQRPVVVGFTTATVFDVSQTDGEDLPDLDAMTILSDAPPPGLREDLEAAITDAGYAVSYSDDMPGNARGYTDPSGKKVVIKSGMSDANQVSTLAHELGHINAGHMDRMDEYHQGHNGSRGAMEIEAESVSFALCAVNGFNSSKKASRYVAGWGNTNPERVRQAADTVAKTVKKTLGSGRWRNMEGAAS